MPALVLPQYFDPTLIVQMLGTIVTFQNGRGLNVRFEVRRTMTPTPDACRVSIFNLSPERSALMAARFSKEGSDALTVRGGYGNLSAGLFRGDVRAFRTRPTGSGDVVTTIEADDGGDAYTDATIKPTYVNAGQHSALDTIEVAVALLSAISVRNGNPPIVVHPDVGKVIAGVPFDRTSPFSYIKAGKASEMLDDIARRLRCRWWLRDGQLHLGTLNQAVSTLPAVIVTDQTLIAPPSDGGSGLKNMDVLFDPNIVPGGQVKHLTTNFRVESVIHSGETRSAAVWSSRVEGRAL